MLSSRTNKERGPDDEGIGLENNPIIDTVVDTSMSFEAYEYDEGRKSQLDDSIVAMPFSKTTGKTLGITDNCLHFVLDDIRSEGRMINSMMQ
jgi:hypothetical protein